MTQKKKINKKVVKNSKLPQVKKELKDFIGDEQGKMTRKDVTKLGVSLAVLGMMMQPGASEGQNVSTHTNHIDTHTPPDQCATHTNITSHSNHSNHGNHSDGGWMC